MGVLPKKKGIRQNYLVKEEKSSNRNNRQDLTSLHKISEDLGMNAIHMYLLLLWVSGNIKRE